MLLLLLLLLLCCCCCVVVVVVSYRMNCVRLCGRVRLLFRRFLAASNGRDGKNGPCRDVRFTKNLQDIIDRGARYKVYASIHTSQLSNPLRSEARATCCFLASARRAKSLFIERADRHAGRCPSRYQYGIDHGRSLVQRRSVWEEQGQGPGGPTSGADKKSPDAMLKSGDPAVAAVLIG